MLAKIRTFLRSILTDYSIAKYTRQIILLEAAKNIELRRLSTAIF